MAVKYLSLTCFPTIKKNKPNGTLMKRYGTGNIPPLCLTNHFTKTSILNQTKAAIDIHLSDISFSSLKL